MTTQGDTKRPGSVNLEIDDCADATTMGGVAIIDQMMRSLGVHATLSRFLPQRSARSDYSSSDFAYMAIASMLVGGDGIDVLDPLHQDTEAARILGCSRIPSHTTGYRILCELAGLPQREFAQVYEPAGPRHERLDLFGHAKPHPAHRRTVPEQPEAAAAPNRRAVRRAERAVARRCLKALHRRLVRLGPWTVVFGDGSDLQVEGRCFDAARKGREGDLILRWMTLRVGPVLVDQELCEGNADEGRTLPGMLRRARGLLREAAGRSRLLALLDAAYCERPVIGALPDNCDWIVCANQYRGVLRRLAQEQPEFVWRSCGPDVGRGWAASEACLFTHQFEGWAGPVTIAARRYREVDELPGCWSYAFLATNLEPAALPPAHVRRHGAAQTLWMLYATKQGHEDHFKTPLRELKMHHPPSGRLGVNQVYYALGSMAANLAMVLRYRVIPKELGAMRLERARRYLINVAGRVVQSGRKLVVRVAGAALEPLRKAHLLAAMLNARSLC